MLILLWFKDNGILRAIEKRWIRVEVMCRLSSVTTISGRIGRFLLPSGHRKLCEDEVCLNSFLLWNICFYFPENRYSSDAEENRLALRQFIFQWFTSNRFSSNYILNKFAYIVNSVFLVDFPQQKWNTFFADILGVCLNKQNCDLFLRILLQINGDVADREIPRSSKVLMIDYKLFL